MTSHRALQTVLRALGVVAFAAGLLTVVTGASTLPNGDGVPASVDNELRFYAAWYVGAGLLLLRVARRPEAEGWTIRAVSAVLWLAATGRVLSWIAEGRPHWTQLVLLAIEVVIPVVVVPWQASVARREE